MKRVITTVLFIAFYFTIYAQQNKDHILMNLTANGGRLVKIVTVKGQGVLFDIANTKSVSYDLVFYDNNMKKKWTYTLSKTDLDIANRSKMENNSQDGVFYADGKFIYVHIKWSSNGMAVIAVPKAYSDFCIGMDGKLIAKNESPLENKSNYRGIITDKENAYLFFDNAATGAKQLYYVMAMDPQTGAFNNKIILHVPTLKSGEWSYAGYADDQLFFYGYEQLSSKESKENGEVLAFGPVAINGGEGSPFQVGIKLEDYHPGGGLVIPPSARVLIDTLTNAIYTYCHFGGVYIQKCSLEGEPIWAKHYTDNEIAKYDLKASKYASSEIASDLYINIDDSTKDILAISNTTETGGSHYCKFFDLDSNGNLKKALEGVDQSSWYMNQNITSPFYSNLKYAQGDDACYKEIENIFSKYPPNKDRPAAFYIHLGDRYWMGVMDAEKFTLDIYKL